MDLIPSSAVNEGPLFAEVDMGGADASGPPPVRATVVQAATVFYDTAATLGGFRFNFFSFFLMNWIHLLFGFVMLMIFFSYYYACSCLTGVGNLRIREL